MAQVSSAIGVISGDVVDSTQLSATQFERVLEQVRLVQGGISKAHKQNAHSIARGDEFQSVVYNISDILRYTLLYRLSIKALGKEFDCRISFAIAQQNQLRDKVDESTGEAFTLSGRALKALKSERLVFNSDQTQFNERFELLFRYLDKQVSELTARQCEVILPLLENISKDKKSMNVIALAEHLGVANATVSKSLKASGWSLIEDLNTQFSEQVTRQWHV